MGYAYDESPFVPLRTTTSGNSRPTEAMQDAEIAKLKADRDEAKKAINDVLDARDRWRDLATKRTSDITALTLDLAAARADLAHERADVDGYRQECSAGPDGVGGGICGERFPHCGMEPYRKCSRCERVDARRAAEAKAVPPNRTGTREEAQAIADWHHDEINRRAAEAKSTTYPFPVESSPSVPPGTIVAMRDGKVVGAITDVAAEAKQLPCPDCKGSGVRVKYHGGSLTDPNVIGLAMESSPCWCQAAEANGEPK